MEYKISNTKVGQKETQYTSRIDLYDPTQPNYKFSKFFNIPATAKVRDFKFDAHTFHENYFLHLQN